jgi:hypothetical protein
MVLYSSLVRWKLEYASLLWNSLANWLQQSRTYSEKVCCNYSYFSGSFKCTTLHKRRRYFHILFTRNVDNGFMICPSLLQIVGIRVPNKNPRDFGIFHTPFPRSICSILCTLMWFVTDVTLTCLIKNFSTYHLFKHFHWLLPFWVLWKLLCTLY